VNSECQLERRHQPVSLRCTVQLTAGIAIAVFMVPLSQIQTLEEISWLAYAGQSASNHLLHRAAPCVIPAVCISPHAGTMHSRHRCP
jgi:hypothetical protein